MSRLYVYADTDMIKNPKTARANKWMKVKLNFNPENYLDTIQILCHPEEKSGMVCDIIHNNDKIGKIVANDENAYVVGEVKSATLRLGRE